MVVWLSILGCVDLGSVIQNPPPSSTPAPPATSSSPTTPPSTPTTPSSTPMGDPVTVVAPAGTEVMVSGADGAWIRTETVGPDGQALVKGVPAGGYVSAVWDSTVDTVSDVQPGDTLYFDQELLHSDPEDSDWGSTLTTEVDWTDPRLERVRFESNCFGSSTIASGETDVRNIRSSCIPDDGTIDLLVYGGSPSQNRAVAYVTEVPTTPTPDGAAIEVNFDQWNFDPGIVSVSYTHERDETSIISVTPIAWRDGASPNFSWDSFGLLEPGEEDTVSLLVDAAYHEALTVRTASATYFYEDKTVTPPSGSLKLVSGETNGFRHQALTGALPTNGQTGGWSVSSDDLPAPILAATYDESTQTVALDWSVDDCGSEPWDEVRAIVTARVGWLGAWTWFVTAPADEEIRLPELDPALTPPFGVVEDTPDPYYGNPDFSIQAVAWAWPDEDYADRRQSPTRYFNTFDEQNEVTQDERCAVDFVASYAVTP